MDAQSLDELAATIQKHGVLEPVLFRVAPNGGIYVVAGERRVAASQQVGRTEIPGVFIDGNAAEIALVENLQRQDLTPVEEAEALQRLKEEQQYTDEPQAFFDLLGKTGTKIDAVDTSAWLADDHNSLGIALTGLRDKIDTRLAAPPPEPAATTKSKKKLA